MAKKIILSSILFLVILTASVYFVFNDEVRIDIGKTKSTFSVYENGSWVVSGVEYVNLFDGTAKMRAKNRSLETNIGDDNITTVTRLTNYKEGISTIEIYTFNPNLDDVELFPISHSIQVINGEDKLLQYEVQKLLYTGETVSGIESPQSFGHQMKVEWQDGNYYSRIWKYANKDEGKLTVKYRIDSDDYSKNVRLFDPPTPDPGTYTGVHFDTAASGNGAPTGITHNGTYFWITDSGDELVYKYWRNGTYTGDNFSIIGSTNPAGIVNNGTYFWLTTINSKVQRYWMNGTYIGDDFLTRDSNPAAANLGGLAYNGTYFWFTDHQDDMVFKYDTSGNYIENFSVEDHMEFPSGINQDGTYFLIVNALNEVHKYWMNGTYIENYTLSSPIFESVRGITQEEGYFWITDAITDEVYKYYNYKTDGFFVDGASFFDNVSVELGTDLNITVSLDGAATTCVDIDHPEYGDNYTCGTPNANFTLNISYFRETEFNDSLTVKTINPPFFMNSTCETLGCPDSSNRDIAFESCMNLSINKTSTLRVGIDLRSEWEYGESEPIVRIRDENFIILEEHNVTLDSSFTDGEYSVYLDNIYSAGTYGFCLRHTKEGELVGIQRADPNWPNYGINITTGEPIISSLSHEVHVYSTSEPVYIKSHQYDEVQNLSFNITGIETASDVKIYINGTLANTLGFIYNTSEGNISETASTSFNLLNGNSTTFSIPKGATVTNTTMNFTGSNLTWEVSEEIIPETWSSSYGSPSPALPSGSQGWYGPVSNAVDGSDWSGTGGWVDGGTLWDVEWMAYVYENYTKDSDAMTGNWSSSYLCNNNADITFDADCWSGSAWVEIVSNSGSTCYNGADRSYRVYELPATCLAQSILQVKNSLQYGDVGDGTVQRATYYEGKANYYRTGSPENMTIEVGIVDGAYEYEGSGELTGSNSTTDFVAEVNSYLDTCAADEDDYCDVPIYFSSDDGGTLTIDNFEVLYTYDPNPISISASIVQGFLNSSTNDVDIPVYFSMTEGSFNVSDLRYDYKGGNDTIEILIYDNNVTMDCYQETANESSSSDTEGCHALNYSGTYDVEDSYLYINYSKPIGATSAKWKVKHGEEDAYNATILATCYAQDNIQLRFFSNVTGTYTTTSWGECYNGTWNLITANLSFFNSGMSEGASSGDHSANMYDGSWTTHAGWSGSYSPFGLNWYTYADSSPNWTSRIYEEAIIWENVTGQDGKPAGETLNVFVYYSSFFKNIPYTWANKIFFIPKTNSSKDVTAYGQTTTIPAYNLTTTNYGGDINLSIKVDESFSCLNLTWSNNATKNESNVINTTWQTINSNVEYLNNTQIWFWADFDNCNASDQRILQPSLEIEGYCIDCKWF